MWSHELILIVFFNMHIVNICSLLFNDESLALFLNIGIVIWPIYNKKICYIKYWLVRDLR